MIQELFDIISPKALGVLLLGSFVVFKIIQWISIELRIRALGGHAPKIASYLPGGIITDSSFCLPPTLILYRP